MRYSYWMLLLAVLPIGVIGCGKKSGAAGSSATASKATPVATAPKSDAATTPAPAGSELSGPAAAVYTFLDAVRTGNDRKADAMLTDLARKKTAEANMVVAPPGSDTARFEVGAVKYLPDDRASVVCKWTDRGDNGKPRTDEITWVLRKEANGWRIGGMIATMFPDRPPTLLNFENPEDMIRQQQALQQEMHRRAEAAKTEAKRPASPAEGENPIRR